jgi:hypothetical protein
VDRIEAVTRLIERYRRDAHHARTIAEVYDRKVVELESYLYELKAPGFRTPGRLRFTGRSRIEPYVVQAGDTTG